MMKKLIVLAVVAMVFGVVSGAYASATDWLIYLRATDQTGGNALNTGCIFGTRTGALDGVDTNDASNGPGTGAAQVAFGCFDLGVGSAGNGYYKDIRSPGTTQLVWHCKLWLMDSCNATGIKFSGWNPTGTFDLPAPAPAGGLRVRIPALDLTFVFDGTANGSSAAPLFMWTIENAQQYKGQANALEVLLEPIPEPASILALASGIVGLVGFGVRRRK